MPLTAEVAAHQVQVNSETVRILYYYFLFSLNNLLNN